MDRGIVMNKTADIVNRVQVEAQGRKGLNYLDLFAGIGGFHLGLINAGFKFDWCGFSEVDKYCKQIYKKHFLESEDLGDVRTIKLKGLPKIDIITFGFPCQDISLAGKRKGLYGERSGLFFDAMQIIEYTKPNIFIFENVKGLFSSNGGKDFEIILQTIADIGVYECEWQLVNTSWLLPQNRERIYFIGHLAGKSRPKVFPFRETDKEFTNGERWEKENSSARQSLRPQNRQAKYSSRNPRFNTAPIKNKNMRSGGSLIFIGGVMGDKNKKWIKDGIGNSKNFPQGQRVYSPEGISAQINAQGGGWGAKTGLYVSQGGVEYNKGGIRRLTEIECERLQGFPNGFTEKGINEKGEETKISMGQRYKMLGNAVTVPIVSLIGKRLLEGEKK